jgi:hypothetical protein
VPVQRGHRRRRGGAVHWRRRAGPGPGPGPVRERERLGRPAPARGLLALVRAGRQGQVRAAQRAVQWRAGQRARARARCSDAGQRRDRRQVPVSRQRRAASRRDVPDAHRPREGVVVAVAVTVARGPPVRRGRGQRRHRPLVLRRGRPGGGMRVRGRRRGRRGVPRPERRLGQDRRRRRGRVSRPGAGRARAQADHGRRERRPGARASRAGGGRRGRPLVPLLGALPDHRERAFRALFGHVAGDRRRAPRLRVPRRVESGVVAHRARRRSHR